MMRKKIKLRKDEGGYALALVLILLILVGLIIGPLLLLMTTSLMSSQFHEGWMHEYYAADAGIEDALWKLINAPPASYPYSHPLLNVNGKNVNVTIEDMGSSTYRITSVAGSATTTIVSYVTITTGFSGAEYTTLEGNPTIGPGQRITGENVYTEGNLTLASEAEIEEFDAFVYAGGKISLAAGAEIEGVGDVIVCAGGNLSLAANAQIESKSPPPPPSPPPPGTVKVYVGGNVSLASSAIIKGDLHLSVGASIDRPENVTGTVYYDYDGCPLSPEGSSEVLTYEFE